MKRFGSYLNMLLVVGLIAISSSAFGQTTKASLATGKIKAVLDGDTYIVTTDDGEMRVRLLHVDCPEKDQPFGIEAKEYAESRIAGRTVTIFIKGYDQYERALGLVMDESGNVFNFELLTMGYAWHYSKYSDDLSASALEQFARQAKLGLWLDENPIAPWTHRRSK